MAQAGVNVSRILQDALMSRFIWKEECRIVNGMIDSIGTLGGGCNLCSQKVLMIVKGIDE